MEFLNPEKNQKLKSIEGLFPKEMRSNEIKNEIDEIQKWEDKIKRKDLKYETYKYIYDFQQFETIRPFGNSIYAGKISINETEMHQTNLLENLVKFNDKSRARSKEDKNKKRNTFDSVTALYEGRELTLNAFRSEIFPIKATQGKGLKISSPKQIFQRLPIALAPVKAGNASENLLNEIRQVMYSLHRAKEITKKVYNSIMNSVKL